MKRRQFLNIDQSGQDPEDPEFSLMVKEKQAVIKSIEKLNYRLTPADLASNSGLSVNQSSFWLNKVAGETRGKLEVTGDGSIVYSFAKNFKDTYLQRGMRKTLLLVGAFSFQLLYWVVRVSFGVALVLSVVIVIVLIIAVMLAASGDNSGDGGSDLGGFFDGRFLIDLFAWNYSPGITYYPNSLPSERRNRYMYYEEKRPSGNFFLQCFSFMFGDGAPNSNLQEVRWQHIARLITENGGVVSTEQLAPFLDGDSSDSGMILSALAQFNGRPEVTPSGFIVYIFPDFIDPAATPLLPTMDRDAYLVEDTWKFSAYGPEQWGLVLFLGVLNFAGSWWLFRHIATVALLHELALLIDVLFGYSILVLLIPAVRVVVLQVLNSRIAERNEKRKKAFALVNKPEGDIAREIQEARVIRDAEREKVLPGSKKIIYDSDRDHLEQQFDDLSGS